MDTMIQTSPKRFLAKIRKTKQCWIWTGAKLKTGYGRFMVTKHKGMLAHRFSYELFKGKIPDKAFVCHSCDNPSCVNPKHLWAGDQLANMADAREKGRTAVGDKNGMRTHPEKRSYGLKNGLGKLLDKDILKIRQLRGKGINIQKIAKRFNISWQYVYELNSCYSL